MKQFHERVIVWMNNEKNGWAWRPECTRIKYEL